MNTKIPQEEKLASLLNTLTEQNAVDPEIINLSTENAVADAMIIAQATSKRHAQGLADAIARVCHEKKFEIFGVEGKNSSDWILIDCNDIIIHILQEDTRALYRLEDLWTRSPNKKEKLS